MEVGLISFWQSGSGPSGDAAFVAEELDLAVGAEALGFDFLGMPEHHFEDYSMSPDNMMSLAYVAALTSRIRLMPAVIVLPWHDPVRVVERLVMLDHLSRGRVLFGFGRGLAPREYAAFRVDQNEARERFDEMAPIIAAALETGEIAADGRFFRIPPTPIRPAPLASFRHRTFGVSNSSASAEVVARLGATQMQFVAAPLATIMPNIAVYRSTWRSIHPTEPAPPLFADFTVCTRSPAVARRAREEWYPRAWAMTSEHYGLGSVDFGKIKGYEMHAGRSDRAPYADTQIWGTPEQIVDRYGERLHAVGGAATAAWIFRFGSMPAEVARESVELFACEVLPKLRELGPATLPPVCVPSNGMDVSLDG